MSVLSACLEAEPRSAECLALGVLLLEWLCASLEAHRAVAAVVDTRPRLVVPDAADGSLAALGRLATSAVTFWGGAAEDATELLLSSLFRLGLEETLDPSLAVRGRLLTTPSS